MAVSLISTAKAFTPAMIGDTVEVTMYDTTSGQTAKAAGTLRAYGVGGGITYAEFDGGIDTPSIKVSTEGINLTINHYEFILELGTDMEDSE